MIFSITLTLLLIIFFKRLFYNKNKNVFSILPGPINLPIIGGMYLLNKDHMDKSFDKLYKKYGDIYYMKFGVHNCIIVNSSKLIKQAFIEQSQFTFQRFNFKSFNYVGRNLNMAAHQNVEFWKKSRQIIMSSVTKSKIGPLDKIYHLQYMKFENHLKELIKSNNIVCLEKYYMKLTFGIIYSAVFNEEIDFENEISETIVKGVCFVFEQLPKVSDFFPILKCCTNYKDVIKSVDDVITVINPLVDKVIKRYNRDNLICALDHIIKSIEDQNEPKLITKESLSYFVMDIFLGGIETTARAFEWITILMINNQHCQNEFYNELKSTGIQYPLLSDRSKFLYVNASIKELFRYKPIAPIVPPHIITEPIIIDNYEIPKNTMIIANTSSQNFDPKYYKDPLTFNPNRFFDVNNSEPTTISFGIGPRSCPFQNFALDELFIITTRLFQTFKFESPISNIPIREETTLKISLQPLNKWYAKVQLRENNINITH